MYFNKTKIKSVYMGKFNKNDDLIPKLEDFLIKNKIHKGFISIIGAVQNATLGFYDQKNKVYNFKTFKKDMEILTINGNISIKDNKPFAHIHGNFGLKDFKSIGGHISSPTIIFAGEFIIYEFKGKPHTRKFDIETGLPLWK